MNIGIPFLQKEHSLYEQASNNSLCLHRRLWEENKEKYVLHYLEAEIKAIHQYFACINPEKNK